jgi:hypothetical protein
MLQHRKCVHEGIPQQQICKNQGAFYLYIFIVARNKSPQLSSIPWGGAIKSLGGGGGETTPPAGTTTTGRPPVKRNYLMNMLKNGFYE